MLTVSLGEIPAPLIDVRDDCRARPFLRGGVPTAKTAISETNCVEVALPRAQRVAARETLVVAASLYQLLRKILWQQNRIYRVPVVPPKLN